MGQQPTSDVDLFSEEAIADPHAVFAELRRLGPVVRLERHRAWLFTDYESVRAGFRVERLSSDRLTPIEQRFTPERRAVLARTIELLRGWMVFHDPPDHQRLREPLRRAFTPRRIADLTPRIEAIVADLLDDLAAADRDDHEPVDLVARFAFPLPAIVIAELLGVPPSDREEFKQWSDLLSAIVFGASERGERAERAAAGTDRFADYFGWLVEKYTAAPEDNLISALIAVTADDPEGVGLTPSELVGACTLLLFGGHETTTNLIATSIRSLLVHPDQLDVFRSRPDLLVPAMEELHRYEGSTKLMVRIVAEDHERGGASLRRGDTVFLGVLSANRDPDAFPEPDRLWLERPEPKGHLGFGYGVHFCLGAALARLESQIAVRELVARFPHMTTDPDATGWSGVLVGRGVSRLPVTLTTPPHAPTTTSDDRDPTDPRPRVRRTAAGWVVAGWRCRACGLPRATRAPWCPECRGELVDAKFGPRGRVWSSTVVHLRVGDSTPPYGLAYVDLVDGPRILAHVDPRGGPLTVGADVDLVGTDATGDALVAVTQPDLPQREAPGGSR